MMVGKAYGITGRTLIRKKERKLSRWSIQWNWCVLDTQVFEGYGKWCAEIEYRTEYQETKLLKRRCCSLKRAWFKRNVSDSKKSSQAIALFCPSHSAHVFSPANLPYFYSKTTCVCVCEDCKIYEDDDGGKIAQVESQRKFLSIEGGMNEWCENRFMERSLVCAGSFPIWVTVIARSLKNAPMEGISFLERRDKLRQSFI